MEVPRELAGRSLLPLTTHQDAPWREYLFAEYHGPYPPLYFPQRTVRDDRYKLIVNLLQDRDNPVAQSCSRTESPRHECYVSASDVAAASDRTRQAYATWSESPPVELYVLKSDPHEWRNRADDPALADV